ncbi:MAG: VCBS repeat-containing protein [Anaerolineales bacterium]|nr:VCBS repeat-containing protein [Anaerolineales bacterium]
MKVFARMITYALQTLCGGYGGQALCLMRCGAARVTAVSLPARQHLPERMMAEENENPGQNNPEKARGGIWTVAAPLTAFLLPTGLLISLLAILIMGSCLAAFLFDDDTRPSVHQAYLADLNGDGHLDAFLVYLNELHRVMVNDGHGRFSQASALTMRSYPLALGNLRGDRQLEVLYNQDNGGEVVLMCADAPTGYTLSTPAPGISGRPFAMHKIQTDGLPGSYMVGCCEGSAYLNNGDTFPNSAPCLSQRGADAAALADLNGDGHADVFLANGWIGTVGPDGAEAPARPNEVWFNDGQGNFSDSGQQLGQAESLAVVVGDVNGDGFPDAVVGNRRADEIWLNDGQGYFTRGERLGSSATYILFLADLDGDGDLDMLAAGEASGRVWLNDGTGQFRAGQRIRYGRTAAVALGDVTGDGLVDLFVADVDTYRVWPGEGNGRFERDG